MYEEVASKEGKRKDEREETEQRRQVGERGEGEIN